MGLDMTVPKIASQHVINITQRCATALAVAAPRVGRSTSTLVLDVDNRAGVAGGPQTTRRAAPAESGAPATISLFEAAERLAGGRGMSAEVALKRTRAENLRLQHLIDVCTEEANSDETLGHFPDHLPIVPIGGLVQLLERIPGPHPSNAGMLLRTARRISSVRSKREERIGQALALIINEAQAGRMDLWGSSSPTPAAEVVVLPRPFLLRNVALDTSLRHVGLAQHAEKSTHQRAIIAPTAARSSAYFNVRLIRAEYLAVFGTNLLAVKSAPSGSVHGSALRHWFTEVHFKAWSGRNEVPTQGQSVDEALQAFPGVDISRQTIRDVRRDLAPVSWNTPGPRPGSRRK